MLTSLTDQTWYDPNDNVIPWSGSNGVYIGPEVNEVVYNSGSLSEGYYKWGGTSWSTITREQAYDTYDLPVYLESMADEMGGMVGFDGDIQQVELLCNFNEGFRIFKFLNKFVLSISFKIILFL